MSSWEAVVVGGGPAGLSCAFWLARYRRQVCVFDTAEPRNEPAWAVHGYPGILEPTPTGLRNRIRQQARDAGAASALDAVTLISGRKNEFRIITAAGEEHAARRVVLAYGLFDRVPDVPGLPALYGRTVFHCADCDGPEAADRPIVVIGHDRAAAVLALYLLHWTPRVSLVTNRHPLQLDAAQREQLRAHAVAVSEHRIARLDASNGSLRAVELEDGQRLDAERIFFHLGAEPRSDLGRQLACELDQAGYIRVDRGQETSTPGVYAIGDITGPPHLASIAAANGVRAALSIHRSLLPPEREL
jgi:thioredoxin reductase